MGQPEQSNELQKLIELATSESTPVGQELNEIDRFILALNIREGKAKVYCPFLYKAYSDWAGKKRLSKYVFYREFKKKFEQRCWDGYKFYFLDPSSFNFTDDMRLEIHEERRKRSRGKRRKNKKKQNQISGPSEGSESQD